eukprot:27851-Pyramimonas_sp.AAC.1
MTIHLSGGNVVLLSLYLLPKEGMQGSHFEKIKALSTVTGSIADPWIIMADWNMPPDPGREVRPPHAPGRKGDRSEDPGHLRQGQG